MIADKQEQLRRLAICDACEHQKIRAGVKTCGKCGCILRAKSRLQSRGGKCPVGKW